jgi:hypothetical protein
MHDVRDIRVAPQNETAADAEDIVRPLDPSANEFTPTAFEDFCSLFYASTAAYNIMHFSFRNFNWDL